MTWVNLDDVYVSTNGGTINGDLAVNGTLTCKNGSTTYNVGSQLATLGDSVSRAPKLIKCVSDTMTLSANSCSSVRINFTIPNGYTYGGIASFRATNWHFFISKIVPFSSFDSVSVNFKNTNTVEDSSSIELHILTLPIV